MDHPQPPRLRDALATALLLAAVGAGCTPVDPGPPGGGDRPRAVLDELDRHNGLFCPAHLPQEDDPGYGFGTSEPAAAPPTLPPIDEARICRYAARESGAAPDGDGTAYAWVRDGRPRRVEAADLPALERALDSLTPAARDRMCTADLGPRWMLSYVHDGDLTGVLVDGFGCREVRLTDEPFSTPPGASPQSLEPGVLTAPDLLAEIEDAYGGAP